MNNKTAQPVNSAVQPKPSRPAKSESARISASQRNTFRMMLATGATVAALVGAQAMAILDRTSAAPIQQSTTANTSDSSANTISAASSDYSATIPTPTAVINTSSAVQRAVSQPRPVTKSS